MTTYASSTATVALQLHVAALRARLFATEADSIIAALSGNFISLEVAIEWADDMRG